MIDEDGSPDPIRDILDRLESQGYVADASIATSIYMAQALERPLLVGGKGGSRQDRDRQRDGSAVGHRAHPPPVLRGPGRDHGPLRVELPQAALWIKLNEQAGGDPEAREQEIFAEPFLLRRPLLSALSQEDKAPVLLIDEVDRAGEEFEAFLLEVLADFQVTIPEIGTVKAKHRPLVILTSNRSRELSDALRRRCLYLWIDFPDLDKELRIVRAKVDGIERELAQQVCRFVERTRDLGLEKVPGISETLDWARAMCSFTWTTWTTRRSSVRWAPS